MCGYHTDSECTFRHTTYVNLCHMCADTADTHNLTLATHECRQTFHAHAHTPRTCDTAPPPPPEPRHSSPAAQLRPPPLLCSLPAPPHIMPGPVLPLTWAAVLQDDGQEEVLGEHGACSQPLLPPPSLLTAPPAQPAGLTAWCWAAEKSSSRPLLTRAERLPGKILPRLELTREGPGPPGKGTPLGWGCGVGLMRPQPSLLTSLLSSPASPPPILNLHPTPKRSPQCHSQAQS